MQFVPSSKDGNLFIDVWLNNSKKNFNFTLVLLFKLDCCYFG